MQFTTPLLIALTSLTLASAADLCPPVYCEIGGRCNFEPDGKHCCGGADSHHVLQCEKGKWAIRNKCAANRFCTCTGSKDLICRNNSKKLRMFKE